MAEGIDIDLFDKSFSEVDIISDDDDNYFHDLNDNLKQQEEIKLRLESINNKSKLTEEEADRRIDLKRQLMDTTKRLEITKIKTSKNIISILHKEFNKIKENRRVLVRDEVSGQKLYNRIEFVSDGDGYEPKFIGYKGAYKDLTTTKGNWLSSKQYLKVC